MSLIDLLPVIRPLLSAKLEHILSLSDVVQFSVAKHLNNGVGTHQSVPVLPPTPPPPSDRKSWIIISFQNATVMRAKSSIARWREITSATWLRCRRARIEMVSKEIHSVFCCCRYISWMTNVPFLAHSHWWFSNRPHQFCPVAAAQVALATYCSSMCQSKYLCPFVCHSSSRGTNTFPYFSSVICKYFIFWQT